MKFNTILIFTLVFSFISDRNPAQGLADNPREQTYLVTSQPYYLSGSTLHYIVYLFDPVSGRNEVPSSILSTEFLDPEGKPIFHHIHSMDQGISPGSGHLPDSLQSGCYWLRAYTRYQVGFTENLIHYLPVYIIHPEDMADPGILSKKFHQAETIAPSTDTLQNQELPESSPTNQPDIRVEIREDKKQHTIREMVNLTVHITDQNGKPVKAHFSFLVRDYSQFHADLLQPHNLTGYRSLPGNSFIYQVGENIPMHAFNYLILPQVKTDAEYLPQNELRLSGRYVDPDTQEPLSFRAITLTQTGQNPGFKLLFTDREGKFEFNDLNFTNRENQLVLNAGINQGILIDNEWIHPSFSPPPVKGNLEQTVVFRQFLNMRMKDQQYRKFYNQTQSLEVDSGQVEISRYRIYQKADRVYDLDDYIELKDMREVIIELLPNVKIFRDEDQTRIKIFYHGNVDILPDPLFLVNGRIVKDNDFILGLDNRNIDKIEVLFKESTLEPFGPIGIGGVVAIYTKSPVAIPYGIPIDFMGYHQPDEKIVQFNPYENGADHFPDFNPLLYWDPDCMTDAEGNGKVTFYTNDLASDFEVIVEGITPDGSPFYQKGHLSVGKPQHP